MQVIARAVSEEQPDLLLMGTHSRRDCFEHSSAA